MFITKFHQNCYSGGNLAVCTGYSHSYNKRWTNRPAFFLKYFNQELIFHLIVGILLFFIRRYRDKKFEIPESQKRNVQDFSR